MSTLSRGDALADALQRIINHNDGCALVPKLHVEKALADYHSTAPTGESVRLAVWLNRSGGIMGVGEDEEYAVSPPNFYLTFTIPPRPNPPEVEGVVDAKETE